jgi:hypothetical protein
MKQPLPPEFSLSEIDLIIHTARQAHRDYHQGRLSLTELQALRPIIEAELALCTGASSPGAVGG